MDDMEERFLRTVGAKYVCDMLKIISDKNCSAQMISKELNIPMASSYRKLNMLEDNKLIYCSKIIVNHSGNEEKFYGSLIDDATIRFHEGIFSVELHQKENCERIVKIWGD
ncbi:MAG: hypothetical protein K0A90_08470 [Methanosarcinaceae archaeon]|nr:hypothetical protein [Methanosarcinaceae archaeon]